MISTYNFKVLEDFQSINHDILVFSSFSVIIIKNFGNEHKIDNEIIGKILEFEGKYTAILN